MRAPPVIGIGAARVDASAGLVSAGDRRGRGSAGGAGGRRIAARPNISPICSAASGRSRCGLRPSARVTAFDSDATAVTALQKAAATAPGLKPIKAETRDLFRRPLVPQELRDIDVAVFDPPRQGAEAQSKQLAASKIPVIVAVSCNIATFVARRAHPDRWRIPARNRDACRSVPSLAACRTGGEIFTPALNLPAAYNDPRPRSSACHPELSLLLTP